ncbi:Plasmid stabilization system protein [Pseudobythopirellula maris]|uniref:Plasmid stabilization system protein n=1 Tax=Pseudobythopirellula maris TaxID=2527991 RepID=A0A5C5ZQ87_9BACT|nr:type II toxin-antitoxin system RelE/ParE family toxin [Pseudobythopirellula maris]TWT89682.1 Plasmid stabilization system protein [Pseudobythopirellula maris]
MTRLIYSKRSRDDPLDILDYLAERSPGTAVRFVEGLMATCELLRVYPQMGTQRDNIAPSFRLFSHRTYAIFYRFAANEGVVRISRVLHPSRETGEQSFD